MFCSLLYHFYTTHLILFANKSIQINCFRLKGPDFGLNSEEMETDEREIRVVLTAPHKDLTLEEEDIAFMLVQYVNESDVSESKGK